MHTDDGEALPVLRYDNDKSDANGSSLRTSSLFFSFFILARFLSAQSPGFGLTELQKKNPVHHFGYLVVLARIYYDIRFLRLSCWFLPAGVQRPPFYASFIFYFSSAVLVVALLLLVLLPLPSHQTLNIWFSSRHETRLMSVPILFPYPIEFYADSIHIPGTGGTSNVVSIGYPMVMFFVVAYVVVAHSEPVWVYV